MTLLKKIVSGSVFFVMSFTIIVLLGLENGKIPLTQVSKKTLKPKVESDYTLDKSDVLLSRNSLVDFAQSLSDGNLIENLTYWIKRNPKGVMETIFEISDTQFQRYVFNLAADIWFIESQEELYDWLMTIEVNNVITHHCSVNEVFPQACIGYAEKILELEKQDSIIAFQLKIWADIDLESAVTWSVANDETYQRFGVGIYRHLLESDFPTALSLLSLLSDRDLSTSEKIVDLIITKIHQQVDDGSVDGSIISNNLLSLPLVNSEFKAMLFLSLSPLVLDLDSSYNAVAFLEAMAEGPERDIIEHRLIGVLVEKNVKDALNYLDSVSDPEKNQFLTKTLVEYWGQDDLSAANDWIQKTESVSNDAVLSLAKIGVHQENIVIVDELIEKIRDTSGNTQKTIDLQLRMAQLIYKINPESATIYINGFSEISEEERKKLLEYIVNDAT